MRSTLLAVVLSLLVFGVLAGVAFLIVPRPAPGTELVELASVADLQRRFEADQGVPRLVMVLSPT